MYLRVAVRKYRQKNCLLSPLRLREMFLQYVSGCQSKNTEKRKFNRPKQSNILYNFCMDSAAQVQAESAVRFLYGNSNNFTRVRDANEIQQYYERPLVVEAWAQTAAQDFELLNDVHRQKNVELQKEVNALREKVRLLEEDLGVHVKLLNQIHATAALKTVMTTRGDGDYAGTTPTPPVTPIMYQQHAQQTNNVIQHNMSRRVSPTTTTTTTYGSHITMKVEGTNMMAADSNSIKYTIIATEEHENNNCEPIEIQLAEEDGALNLNNSADSGRLEICLSGDEQQQAEQKKREFQTVKEEQNCTSQNAQMPARSGILVKRRKLSEAQYHYSEASSTASPATATSVICELPSSTSQINNRLSSEGIDSTNHSMSQVHHNHHHHHNDENVMVSIGPNYTRVPLKLYESINWELPSIATRKLLMAVFDRQTLATHSMTGKPSPAFKGQAKPQKQRLDPRVTEDIIFVVTRRCKVSDKEVRNAITTKCADENKMMKQQIKKNRSLLESNKENFND